jgi:hypothetical protein
MPSITLNAHFNGQQIMLDEPFEIPSNAKLLVTVLENTDFEQNNWTAFSASALALAYSDVDFSSSGLVAASLFRLGFLAVIPVHQLVGSIGRISNARHQRLRRNFWASRSSRTTPWAWARLSACSARLESWSF